MGLIMGVCLISGVPLMAFSPPDLFGLLPDSVPGWTVTGEYSYSPETLYEYIDGGAELYLSYGFRGMINRVYTGGEQPDIVLDLFDMGDPENAFGIFAHSREEIDSSFGQGSQYTGGLLVFWKDRYYISILASPETAASKKAVFHLAHQIEQKIPTIGKLPQILNYLPAKNLRQETIRCFTHPTWINSFFFIATENIFHIGKTSPAALARYPGQGTLLVIMYVQPENAQQALKDFKKFFLLESSPDKVVQIEDGSWIGGQVKGRVFNAVFQGESQSAVKALLEQVSRLPEN